MSCLEILDIEKDVIVGVRDGVEDVELFLGLDLLIENWR